MRVLSRNPIFQSIAQWFERTFADPEVINLFMTLVISILLIEFFGGILMPVLVSIVIAYLLNPPTRWLIRRGCPRLLAVWAVYILFLGLFIYAMLCFAPLLWRQLIHLLNQMPDGFGKVQIWVTDFTQKYPHILSSVDVQHMLVYFKDESPKLGQTLIHYSWMAIPSISELVLYLALVPLLVFFFLKDSRKIMLWLKQFLPRRRTLVNQVSSEVYHKIGTYVKGRILEIFIVGVVATISFQLLRLNYALLLGALVGLSVIVPYIGAIIVTIPVIILALIQWGFAAHFWYLVVVYALIIAIDGNILFPLLFAQTMDLHPVVIILAVLIFGGIWGFWGVFFAIPLATLVNAVLQVWPRNNKQ
jgi:putative permease